MVSLVVRMVKIKVCGITNLDDAMAAVDAGCNALGFVFYKKSPRYISPKKARDIIRHLPDKIIKIGVFVNEQPDVIKGIARLCNLDMLQFHGYESVDFCGKFKGYRIIKAFRVKDKVDLSEVLKYQTFAYLFDTFVRSKVGGTGRTFNWQLYKHLVKIKRPVFLSGGLNENNVREAIRMFKPEWVDVSTSVEISPGKKDRFKLKRFISSVKEAKR